MSIFLDKMTGADSVPTSHRVPSFLGMWPLLGPLFDGEAVRTRAYESWAKELVEDGLQKIKETTMEKQSVVERTQRCPCLRGLAAPLSLPWLLGVDQVPFCALICSS